MKKLFAMAVVALFISLGANAQSTQSSDENVQNQVVAKDAATTPAADATVTESGGVKKSCGGSEAKAGCCSSKKGKASASKSGAACCSEGKKSASAGCNHSKGAGNGTDQ